MDLNSISALLINYGLAGIVIYLFYMLFKNELHQLRESIDKLSDKIEKLVIKLEHE